MYGTNLIEGGERFVKFTPVSDEVYLFDGVTKIYDYNFDIVKFEARYLPEYFDKYAYLVGDIADDILRLKGFALDAKSKNYFHYIPEYITESCAYNCKYYVLKRIKNIQ